MGSEVDKVQQQIDTHLLLPPLCTMLSESHPCVGAAFKVFETAVTHRQVETQDRGQLDIVHALMSNSLGSRVHLAIQHHPIRLPIAANG